MPTNYTITVIGDTIAEPNHSLGDRYIRLPEDAARVLMPVIGNRDREHAGLLSLNTRNKLIAVKTISVGTLNNALVHPREVFRPALEHNAAAIIAWHNHPSGDPSPSAEDRTLTTRLSKAGAVLGIKLLDHVIVCANSYHSFKENEDL